eukprot:jgi/Astpho2/3900/Aster-04408
MKFSFVVLLPFMLHEPYVSRHMPTLEQQWKGLIAVDIFSAANLSLHNLSLVLITLSLNQVIRRAQVLQSMLLVSALAMLAAVIERSIPTLPEVASLAVLSIGAMIPVWEGYSDWQCHWSRAVHCSAVQQCRYDLHHWERAQATPSWGSGSTVAAGV